jgi:type VI secretion system secreted protein VgrG
LASRLLTQSEIEFARQVFEDRLPYDRVRIASFYLPGNHGTAVTLASLSTFIPARSMRSYTIYSGPVVFRDGADARDGDTFIHELTHVWQGFYGQLGWEYMARSLVAQGRAVVMRGDRHGAYEYEPGSLWRSYNVEQQAQLVEDWFARGMRADDERYRYIAENIRRGRN